METARVEELLIANRTADERPARPASRRSRPPLTIKKLSPALRKPKPDYLYEPNRYRRLLGRLKEDSQFARSVTQFTFAALCVWIGVEFSLFVRWGMSDGLAPFYSRPPGVEGFLPISALISAAYWLNTGIINHVHPSGLFILLAIVLVSIVAKKAFCSWLCPIGTLSESLWLLGQKLFKRTLTLPRWLDIPLRSLKYLLLGFFAFAIARMSEDALGAFIYSPYNKMADVKMYMFFAEISSFALYTILALLVLSVFIKNFWCRFLCPYGALLGIVGWLSPLKITRTKSTCIDCMLCTKACPANIAVHKAGRVWSDECTSCMACVQVCPVKETLEVRPSAGGKRIPPWVVGSLVVGIFAAITGAAILAGDWKNSIDQKEYLHRFKNIDSPLYQHFQGRVPKYGPND
ncbi:MAG: 4Fe-4S binding protein [Bacteroidota bacterium]